MNTAIYSINGMTCASCASSIENSLLRAEDIKSAKVNFSEKTLTLEFAKDELLLEDLQNRLIDIGNYKISKLTRAIISKYKDKSIYIWGILGSFGIGIVFYLIQLLGMQDLYAPIEFSIEKWYFVIPLISGFGVQMGLFRAIHLKVHEGGGGAVAVSGGTSVTAMIACCLHNLVALLPFLGLAGTALFLSKYQDYIFGISIAIMLLGILYMWNKYKKTNQCHV